MRSFLALALVAVSFTWQSRPALAAQAAPVAVAIERTELVRGLGATQGVTVHEGLVYLYGDASPGVIREYRAGADAALTPTGRAVQLTVAGENVINHPTGLIVSERFGAFVGNSVTASRKGVIYRLDWERMWRTGTLDGAILGVTADDLAVQGSRPALVRVGARWLIATSDYGDQANAIRLYDPEALASARKTSDPGVLVASFPTGPWVQNLAWLDARGQLVAVQNKTEGLGWRLTFIDLAASLARGAQVTTGVFDLAGEDELEGFAALTDSLGLAVSSSDVVAAVGLRWP